MTEENKEYSSKEYFENKFRRSDPWQLWGSGFEQTKYKRQVSLIEKYYSLPEKILEIGCAEGAFTKILRENFPEATIIGVDISSNAIQRARNKVKNAKFIVGDAVKITERWTENEFDVIVLGEVVYFLGARLNFLQMYKFLRKIARLLRQGGILITTNVFDLTDNPKTLIIRRPIIQSYYTLLSGLLKLVEGREYKEYKKKEKQALNYGIRVFRKSQS